MSWLTQNFAARRSLTGAQKVRQDISRAADSFSGAPQVRRPARQTIPDQENLAGRSLSSPPPGTPQQANPLHRGVVARSTIEIALRLAAIAKTRNTPAPERSWNPPSPLLVEGAPAP